MVLAYHCVFGFYGFWLPNDPRGSGSDYIANWELLRYGGATKVHDRRRSRASQPHDRGWRLAAKQTLAFPPVKITGIQAVTVVAGFQRAAEQGGYLIHACAILPDHVHLVIGRHQRGIRQIVGHLKSQSTRLLREMGKWPEKDRPVWGDHGWNVFLNDPPSVERAIRYAERNPAREGKKTSTLVVGKSVRCFGVADTTPDNSPPATTWWGGCKITRHPLDVAPVCG